MRNKQLVLGLVSVDPPSKPKKKKAYNPLKDPKVLAEIVGATDVVKRKKKKDRKIGTSTNADGSVNSYDSETASKRLMYQHDVAASLRGEYPSAPDYGTYQATLSEPKLHPGRGRFAVETQKAKADIRKRRKFLTGFGPLRNQIGEMKEDSVSPWDALDVVVQPNTPQGRALREAVRTGDQQAYNEIIGSAVELARRRRARMLYNDNPIRAYEYVDYKLRRPVSAENEDGDLASTGSISWSLPWSEDSARSSKRSRNR